MSKDYIVLDLETTGLHPTHHGITEIAALRFDGTEILDTFHTLINPERHISAGITRLTGITNEMVADAPTIGEVMPQFRDFLAEHFIVGHNVSFDFRFLNYYHYQCFEHYLSNETICTMQLSRKYLPDLPNKRLGTVCEHFGIVNEQAHRAMSDTLVTLEIFKKYLQKASFPVR
jgi:DNA polymerase-3 subunit epsilon